MARVQERLKALQLRRSGQSIKEIAKNLNVSVSSASNWCRDITLTKKQILFLTERAKRAGHAGRLKGAEYNKRKKQDRIAFHQKMGKNDIGTLTKRERLLVGLGLYWGEGNKNSYIGLSNSDPEMIAFVSHWFQNVFGVKKEDFMPRIYINEMHRPRTEKVLRFWISLLKIPRSQFRPISFIKAKTKKRYENYDNYYGVVSLRISKGTDLKYKILGLIDGIK